MPEGGGRGPRVLELLGREDQKLLDVPFGGSSPRWVALPDLSVSATRLGQPVERHAQPDEPSMRLRIPPGLLALAPSLVDGIHVGSA